MSGRVLIAFAAVSALLAGQTETVALKRQLANLLMAERPDEVLALVAEARAKAPKDAELLIYAGEAHFQLEENEKAVAAFRVAIALDPSAAPHIQNLGHALLRLGRPAEARAHFQIVAERGPNPGARARALTGVGLALAEEGDEKLARARFEEALKIEPGQLRALYRLALIQLKAGENAAAVENLRAVVTKDPLYEGAAYNLALAYRAAKDESAAKEWEARFKDVRKAKRELELLKGALRADPGKVALMLEIGRVYARAGAGADAVSWLGRYLQIRPNDAEARQELEAIRAKRQ